MNFEKYQEKFRMGTYVNKDNVDKELAKIPDEVSSNEILRLYKDYKEKYLHSLEIAKDTHSDFFYWQVVVQYETYEYLYQLMALIYKEQIEEDDYIDIKKLKEQAKAYNLIYNKIKENIKGLQEFKPTAYKSKIELLENLAKEVRKK